LLNASPGGAGEAFHVLRAVLCRFPLSPINPVRSESAATNLRCVDCQQSHALEYRLACEGCGGLLEIQYDIQRLSDEPMVQPERTGVWRYAAWMPVHDAANFVTLGEQPSPLFPIPRLGTELGLSRLLIKFDGSNPTGTVKDRSSQTAVASARQFGFDAIGVVSTGNAASSIATYAARAGLRAVVCCYMQSTAAKMAHIAGVASDVIWYAGVYDDMIRHFDAAVDRRWFFDGGATRNAYKQEGKKSIALETYEQLGRAPDLMVYPVGMGETLLAGQRAWAALAATGRIEKAPRPVSAQSTEANTIAEAWRTGGELGAKSIGYTVAEGTAVGDMGAKGRLTLRRIREQDGLAGDVSDDETLEMQRRLAQTEGLWIGPTGAVPLAVIARLAREGQVDPDAEIVCISSETGLKGDWPPLTVRGEQPSLELIRRTIGRPPFE
jgi:threonine synthase